MPQHPSDFTRTWIGGPLNTKSYSPPPLTFGLFEVSCYKPALRLIKHGLRYELEPLMKQTRASPGKAILLIDMTQVAPVLALNAGKGSFYSYKN